jgi:hypothetical protein
VSQFCLQTGLIGDIFALDSEFLGHMLLPGGFQVSVDVSRLRVECVTQGSITISADIYAKE